MTNRIHQLFQKKNKNILSVFFTAGYPDVDSTGNILRELNKKGIDMVEIGIPFSDPMADGPVIQKSSTVALQNGITLKKILKQIENIRKEIPDMPFIAMGYINPILQYGIEKFISDAKKAGIDGLIIPDLPFDEYIETFEKLCDEIDLPIIMLITPETSEERIRLIDSHSKGFIYMVSSASTTGTRDRFSSSQHEYFNRINSMNLKNPRLIGFGISNPETLKDAFRHANGAIIGSHFIKSLTKEKDIASAVNYLLESIGEY